MGKTKKNPDGTESPIEGQEGTELDEAQGDESQESGTQESKGDESSENDTEKATKGGDGKKKAKEKPFSGKIKNPDVANRTVFGVSGEPVVFNDDGVAECSEADGLHFIQVPGYQVV